MARSLKVEIEPKVFTWLRESSGWSREEVARRLNTSIEVIEAIEAGEWQPTLRQLRELSVAYKRPLAAFLLSEPLVEPPMPKDYRMLPGKKGIFDRKTILAIRKARGLQEVGAELLINVNETARPKVARLRTADDPEQAASGLRIEMGLSADVQRRFRTSYELFHHLRNYLDGRNILVFQFSMPVEDARGFALTDAVPNVVVINSADTIEARLFSLMHELGHVLLGETVIDLPEASFTPNHNVEIWCNRFASEFLLPKELAIRIFDTERQTLTETATLKKLANRYKVSKGMLNYKMLKLDYISHEAYEEILARYKPPEPPSEPGDDEDDKNGGGIPVDVRCLSEVGGRFISMVAENYDRNFITYTDALNYLSIRSKNFDRVLARARE